MNTLAIRTNIKRVREDKGYSQSQMAEKLHMDERNYKRIENGEKKIMDLDMLGRIAEALDTDWAELVSGEVVNIENNGTANDNSSPSVGYHNEVTVNNFPPELKKAYEDLIAQLHIVLEQKDKTINLLMELQGKK